MLFRIIWSAIDLEYLDLSLIDTVGAIFCLDQVLHLLSFLAWRVPHWKKSLPLAAFLPMWDSPKMTTSATLGLDQTNGTLSPLVIPYMA